MSALSSAINLLQDTVVSLCIPGDGDTGLKPSAWGTPVTVLVDKVSVKDSIVTADHSAGQSGTPINRANKFDFEVTIDFKLFGKPASGNGITYTCRSGKQIRILINATQAATAILGEAVEGIITEAGREYAGPSTLRVTIKPYGPLSTAVTDFNGTTTIPDTVQQAAITA